MLKIALLAVLVNGCISFKQYTAEYKTFFEKHPTNDLFPTLAYYNEDLTLSFSVSARGDNDIVFETLPESKTRIHFQTTEGIILLLHSLAFEFRGDSLCNVHHILMSGEPIQQWTIVSPVYTRPTIELRDHAMENAVDGSTFFLLKTAQSIGQKSSVSFNVGWIALLLTKVLPRGVPLKEETPDGFPPEKLYIGIPLTLRDATLMELNWKRTILLSSM